MYVKHVILFWWYLLTFCSTLNKLFQLVKVLILQIFVAAKETRPP